jgi:hypothetical protein
MTTTTKRPRAARQPDRCRIGSTIEPGKILNGHAATIGGVVLYSEYCTLTIAGQKYTGEINIVKRPFGEFGRNYVVTVDGQMLFVDGQATWFKTLEAAAHFVQA